MAAAEDDFKPARFATDTLGIKKHAASPAAAKPAAKKLRAASVPDRLSTALQALPLNQPSAVDRLKLRALFCGVGADTTVPADRRDIIALRDDDSQGDARYLEEELVNIGAQCKAAAARPAAECPPLSSWLSERGLDKYIDAFERAGADLALLPCLKDADLLAMGIVALGARKKVLLGAAELAAAGGTSTAPSALFLPERAQASNGQGDFASMAASYGIASYFVAPQRPCDSGAAAAPQGGSILRYLQDSDGRTLKIAPAAAPRLAASIAQYSRKPKEWAHKAAAGGAGGGRQWGGRAAAVHPFKSWQLVAGTTFVVDRFSNLPPTSPQQCHWFLTHFHADHYKGLTSRFDRGIIYCTPITAALVRQQLRVPQSRLHEVAIGAAITVDGVRVTFLEANHCPGAAMLLFEPPGRRPVLNTGDCRLTTAVQAMPELQAARGNIDLILDTTYCDPQYCFPPQHEVLQFAIDAVKAEAFNPKTLFLFGSYTIGKERLYLEAARVLGRKVYVSSTKKKVLDCLGLPPEYASLLTTDDAETNLHAVPLHLVSQKHMANALRHYRGRFANVVGFQPTGWTHERDAAASKGRGRRRQKGTLITYQVPYSEHSSFTELREFVTWLQPNCILPHVNNDGGGPKAQRMVALLKGYDR